MATWPSKQQHDAVVQRVGTAETKIAALEQGGGGGGGGGESTYLGLPSLVYSTPISEVGNLARIRLSWRRRSVHVAGFRLVGDIPLEALAGVGLMRGGSQEANQEFGWYPGYPYTSLARRVVQQDNVTFTDFFLSHQPVKTDADLMVSFVADRPYRLSTTPINDVPDVSITQTNSSGEAVAGYAYIDVLSTRPIEVPIMPVPTMPAYEEGSNSTRHFEVVWPESEAPYLHLYQARDASGNEVHYHLPFTAGLPAPESPESGGAV